MRGRKVALKSFSIPSPSSPGGRRVNMSWLPLARGRTYWLSLSVGNEWDIEHRDVLSSPYLCIWERMRHWVLNTFCLLPTHEFPHSPTQLCRRTGVTNWEGVKQWINNCRTTSFDTIGFGCPNHPSVICKR
jgi:hypothetical protein